MTTNRPWTTGEAQHVVVRRAAPCDGPMVRRLVFEILREYDVPPDPLGSDADVLDFGQPANRQTIHLVGDDEGRPVGSAILTPESTSRVKLSKLFVSEPYRGTGLGRALLRTAIAEARASGYGEVFLTTRSRYEAAVRLYEAEGWIRGPNQPGPGPDRLYFKPLDVSRRCAKLSRAATQPPDQSVLVAQDEVARADSLPPPWSYLFVD